MGNVEDIALRNIRSGEQEKRKDFTNRNLGKGSLTNRGQYVNAKVKKLTDEGWGQVWDANKLRYVAESEWRYENDFEKGENVKECEVLESLMNYGVNKLKWFGGDLDKETGRPRFLAHSNSSRDFDDKKHRIDSIVTIATGKAIRAEHPKAHGWIKTGVDVTTWKPRTDSLNHDEGSMAKVYFAEKISRSNNENDAYQKPSPFGFSQFDFYTDPWTNKATGERKKSSVSLIPRFIIGINGELADSILQYVFVPDGKGKYKPKSEDTVQHDTRTTTTQFKVLSEVNKQADMLIGMMPDDYTADAELVSAKEDLAVIKEITGGALEQSADAVIESLNTAKCLPAETMKALEGADGAEKVKIISELFRDHSHKNSVFHYDATYDGIMSAAEGFIDYSTKDDTKGIKPRQPRNNAVEY